MNNKKMSKVQKLILFFIVFEAILFLLDKVLGAGILLISVFTFLLFYFLSKKKLLDKETIFLFLAVLILHSVFVCFVNYAHFQPFGDGGGDFIEYHNNAISIAERVRNLNFSISGLTYSSHVYPVIVGYLYALTFSNMLIGELFNAWLVALCALVAYFTAKEVGGSKKGAILAGAIVGLYPSLLFYGSLMLKDALTVFLCLLGVFLILKIIQKFSFLLFIFVFIDFFLAVHFRFYSGYSLMITFFVSWIFFSNLEIKKRLVYALVMILLMGVIPQLAADQGYMGMKSIQEYVNQKTVTSYREEIYTLPIGLMQQQKEKLNLNNQQYSQFLQDQIRNLATGSNFEHQIRFSNPVYFIFDYAIAFVDTLLGPFPWQINFGRQLLALGETVPWYFILFFIVVGIKNNIFKECKKIIPILIFSVTVLAALALFISNYGVITRIRIQGIAALVTLLPLGINNNFFEKFYDISEKKISKVLAFCNNE